MEEEKPKSALKVLQELKEEEQDKPQFLCKECGGPEGECECDTNVVTGPARRDCEICGKSLTVLKSGKLRFHKCEPKEGEKPKEETNDGVEVTAASHPTVTPDMVIAAFIKTRDEIAEIEKEVKLKVAKLKQVQDARAKWLMGQLDTLGIDSMKGEHGTVFIDWKDSATVADRDAFLTWVKEDFDHHSAFLNSAVNKTAVKQMLEDTEGELPPGVNYTKIKDVKVRRA